MFLFSILNFKKYSIDRLLKGDQSDVRGLHQSRFQLTHIMKTFYEAMVQKEMGSFAV